MVVTVLMVFSWLVLGHLGARGFLDDFPGSYGGAIWTMLMGPIGLAMAFMCNSEFYLRPWGNPEKFLAAFFRQKQ